MIKEVSTHGAVIKIMYKIERRILSKMSAGMRDYCMGTFLWGGNFRRGLFQRLSSYHQISDLYHIGFIITRHIEDKTIRETKPFNKQIRRTTEQGETYYSIIRHRA